MHLTFHVRPKLKGLPRAERIALAVPHAAVLLARADACRDDDVRCTITYALYQHLAGFGLDFRADVIAAIDAPLGARHRAERALADIHRVGYELVLKR